MSLEKCERFAIFVERLLATAPVDGAQEAYVLLGQTLNAVEDEFTDIAFDPSNWKADGRMYPPQADSARDVAGRSELTRYRSKAHNTYISANGAIRIDSLNGDVVLSKPGSDGNEVVLP